MTVFILTFCSHRASMAWGVAEGFNNKITAAKPKSCVCKHREHFKTAMSSFRGGLDF